MDEPGMEDTQPGIEQDETTELGQEVVVKTVSIKVYMEYVAMI